MLDDLKRMTESARWRMFVDAALAAAEKDGSVPLRRPGRGLSNIWELRRPDGRVETVSIRTSMDRQFAFPPLESGTRWKTLDEVDAVLVASVNDRDAPTEIEVYRFPAGEVREHLFKSYAARKALGKVVRDDFGMWVSMDPPSRRVPSDRGTSLARSHPPIASYSIAELIRKATAAETRNAGGGAAAPPGQAGPPAAPPSPETIADVILSARARIATIAGVSREGVKLDLKLEF